MSLPIRPGRCHHHALPGRIGTDGLDSEVNSGVDTDRDSGVAAVEFALVLPLLVMLIFAAVTAGSIGAAQLDVNSTARDAARAGAIDSGSGCSLASARLADAATSLGATSCTSVATCPGVDSVVRIDATRNVTIPFIGDRTIGLSSTARYRCEI